MGRKKGNIPISYLSWRSQYTTPTTSIQCPQYRPSTLALTLPLPLPLTLLSSASVEKPRPYTVLARMSDHWPNFCEVLVNIMLGVMVLLITAWKGEEINIRSNANFLLPNSTWETGDKLSLTGGRRVWEDTHNRKASSLEDLLLWHTTQTGYEDECLCYSIASSQNVWSKKKLQIPNSTRDSLKLLYMAIYSVSIKD